MFGNVYGESLLVAGDGNGGELVVVVPKVSQPAVSMHSLCGTVSVANHDS